MYKGYRVKPRWLRLLYSLSLIIGAIGPAVARDEISERYKSWASFAPRCMSADNLSFPSKQDCEDGDMTLFNGLLCIAKIEAGCTAVKAAQDATGRWHRSPRLAADPNLRKENSFSPDMALGVQLYLLEKNDRAAAIRWVSWLEENVTCTVSGTDDCLMRSPFPRFCTDDSERGCTIRPGDAAILASTLKKLNAMPAESTILGTYLRRFSDLYPKILVLDASMNKPGYSRHLVAVSILIAQRTIDSSIAEAYVAAKLLAEREPNNPFFLTLAGATNEKIRALVMDLCPIDGSEIHKKAEWAWERTDGAMAWRESMLWDCMFITDFAGLR